MDSPDVVLKVKNFLRSRYPESFGWSQLAKENPSLTVEEVVDSLIYLQDEREIEEVGSWPPKYRSLKVTGGTSTTSIYDYHHTKQLIPRQHDRVLSAPHFDPRINPRLG